MSQDPRQKHHAGATNHLHIVQAGADMHMPTADRPAACADPLKSPQAWTGGKRLMTMTTKMLQATVMIALAHHSSCSLTGAPSGAGLPVVIGLPLQQATTGLGRLMETFR